MELGNYLIKRVAHTLRGEFPLIQDFCTLSPVPGFSKWLQRRAAAETSSSAAAIAEPLLSPAEADTAQMLLASLLRPRQSAASDASGEGSSTSSVSHGSASDCGGGGAMGAAPATTPGEYRRGGLSALVALTELDGGRWHREPVVREALKPLLVRLAVRYLVDEKRSSSDRAALDPVANFHLRNGALLHGVNFGADLSAKGLNSSCGIMVNYLYDLGAIRDRSKAYIRTGQVPFSPAVRP